MALNTDKCSQQNNSREIISWQRSHTGYENTYPDFKGLKLTRLERNRYLTDDLTGNLAGDICIVSLS